MWRVLAMHIHCHPPPPHFKKSHVLIYSCPVHIHCLPKQFLLDRTLYNYTTEPSLERKLDIVGGEDKEKIEGNISATVASEFCFCLFLLRLVIKLLVPGAVYIAIQPMSMLLTLVVESLDI